MTIPSDGYMDGGERYTDEEMELIELEENKTREIVIFRKYKDTGEIIAFIPESPSNYGYIESYMHIGQHGEADYWFLLSETVPAKPLEYDDLLAELISIGYDPIVKRRLLREYIYWIH